MRGHLGTGEVYPSALTNLTSYTDVQEIDTASSSPAFTCPTTFESLDGELFASNSTASNLQYLTVSSGTAITLHAVIQPGSEEFPVLPSGSGSTPVTFYDNGTALSTTGTIITNSTGNYVKISVTPTVSGTHIYTASYPAYNGNPVYTFGAVEVVVE